MYIYKSSVTKGNKAEGDELEDFSIEKWYNVAKDKKGNMSSMFNKAKSGIKSIKMPSLKKKNNDKDKKDDNNAKKKDNSKNKTDE